VPFQEDQSVVAAGSARVSARQRGRLAVFTGMDASVWLGLAERRMWHAATVGECRGITKAARRAGVHAPTQLDRRSTSFGGTSLAGSRGSEVVTGVGRSKPTDLWKVFGFKYVRLQFRNPRLRHSLVFPLSRPTAPSASPLSRDCRPRRAPGPSLILSRPFDDRKQVAREHDHLDRLPGSLKIHIPMARRVLHARWLQRIDP